MIYSPELCLGTVQFGLPYGVTNNAGQVSEVEIRRIFKLAVASGIHFLDTAQAYGTAETLLGSCWPTDAPRRLISKLPAGSPQHTWELSLAQSLQRLQASKLDGYLLHRSSDLLTSDGGELLNWLEGTRERGLVNRIGVSIYEGTELDALPLDRLQLVQLPLSVYDQRLLHDGTIARLQDLGIAVHVRSVFLQGLLLQPPHQWPEHLSSHIRSHHARWLEYLHVEAISPLTAALSFVHACEGVEAVLFGVLSSKELTQVLHAWDHVDSSLDTLSVDWAWDSRLDLDPRCWPPR